MKVILWVDPVCPYSWQLWQWLSNFDNDPTIDVNKRLISLALLNKDNESAPKNYRAPWAESLRIVRILAAIESQLGYSVFCTVIENFMDLWHTQKIRPIDHAIKILLDPNLPEFISEATNPLWDSILTEETMRSQRGINGHGGSPIVEINGRNFFGPRFTTPPCEKKVLLDAFYLLAQQPQFCGFSKNPE